MKTREYRMPLTSSLEKFREDIAGFRKSNWPYREIRDWLEENHDAKFHHSSIASFCEVRGIKKGRGETIQYAEVRVVKSKKRPAPNLSTDSLDRAAHTQEKLDGDDFDFGA